MIQAQIPRVPKNLDAFREARTGLFKKPKIVLLAMTKVRLQDPTIRLVDDDLRFDRMPFFLPRVMFSLFFLGRCMGLSLASTTTTSMSGFSKHTFLFGSRNTFDWIKTPSIQTQFL